MTDPVTDPEESRPAPPADPPPQAPPAAATRPFVERIGLVFIAIVAAALFGAIAVAAWAGGELFLAVMAAIGAVMTVWAAGSSVRRG